MLNPKIFNETQKILSFHSQLYCFATRINTQLSEYFLRIPDTGAKFIDAFTINWNPYLCYLLPPFIMLPRALQKIQVEQIEALIVAPYLANPALVQSNFELSTTRTSDLQTHCNQFDITTRFPGKILEIRVL